MHGVRDAHAMRLVQSKKKKKKKKEKEVVHLAFGSDSIPLMNQVGDSTRFKILNTPQPRRRDERENLFQAYFFSLMLQ